MASKPKPDDRKPRIFLFCGDDDYTTAQKVARWREAFVKKHSNQGVINIDCESTEDWHRELAGALASQGLFSSTRLVVAKSVFTKKAEDTEWLLDKLDDVDAQTFLLFWERMPVKKTLRLYKKLSALSNVGTAQVFEHGLPVGMELNRFLANYAASKGYKLNVAAAESLARALGRDLVEKSFRGLGSAAGIYDLWQATAEIDKLGTYAAGREITVSDVAALVPEKFSDNIFLLTNAIGAKQNRSARNYLDQLFSGNSNLDAKARALPIVGALASQFRNLLLLSAARTEAGPGGDLAGALGWTPYRINANLRVLQNFTEHQLRKMLEKLLEIDRKIKSTTLPPKFLLGQLIG